MSARFESELTVGAQSRRSSDEDDDDDEAEALKRKLATAADDDDDDDDDVDDAERLSEQIREQYARTHGLRRHTVARPDLIIPNSTISTFAPNFYCTHPSGSIEPSLLSTRLHHLQQQQQRQQGFHPIITSDDDEQTYVCSQSQLSSYHQRNPHSTSYMGLSEHSHITAVSDVNNQQQRANHWLSPPVQNQFRTKFLVIELFELLCVVISNRFKSSSK